MPDLMPFSRYASAIHDVLRERVMEIVFPTRNTGFRAWSKVVWRNLYSIGHIDKRYQTRSLLHGLKFCQGSK